MQVVPRGAAGVADVGDHLPGLHLLALGDADLTAMGIERLQAAAVVDLDVVPVAAAPAAAGLNSFVSFIISQLHSIVKSPHCAAGGFVLQS